MSTGWPDSTIPVDGLFSEPVILQLSWRCGCEPGGISKGEARS